VYATSAPRTPTDNTQHLAPRRRDLSLPRLLFLLTAILMAADPFKVNWENHH
jgi:hypothetical protein